MNEKLQAHWKKHKQLYLGVGIGLTFATITYAIMRRRYETLAIGGVYGLETADTSVTMRPLSFLSHQYNVVNVAERFGRGHPGYIVFCKETGDWFSSQRAAAAHLGISETLLSKHLSGKIQNAAGFTFERAYFSTS